jgi:hypothetical protein
MIDTSNQAITTPKYLDRTRAEYTQTQELQSRATTQEQNRRDDAASNNGLLESNKPSIIPPDKATISQLEANRQTSQLDNANGLGRTAVSSYQSLASAEQSQQLAQRVRVNITA